MKFRLKKEAINFFPKRARDIEKLEYWKGAGIHENLLEIVERVYISYGHKTTETSKSLCNWNSSNKRAEFKFTIVLTDIEHNEYDRIDEVKIRGLMEDFQSKLNQDNIIIINK